jgi:hypothetical protein
MLLRQKQNAGLLAVPRPSHPSIKRGNEHMKRIHLILLSLILLCFCGYSQAQSWSGIIAPTRAINWSLSGAGAIPTNRTQCGSTIAAGASAATINAAIAGCSANTYVLLGAGTFNLTSAIVIAQSNVTLRGAGANQTLLVFSGSSSCGNTTAAVCVGTDGNWSGGPDHLTTFLGAGNPPVSGTYTQGATQVLLGSTAGLSVGQFLILDQTDDSSDTGNVYICGLLASTCSQEGQDSGGGRGGNHALLQYAQVTAISGTTVTIGTPLYMPSYRTSQSPGAWWATSPLTGVGVENLEVNNTAGVAGSNILFNNTAQSWITGVASIGGASRSHVDLQYSPFNTIQNSYFYGAAGHNLSYGIEPWMAGSNLMQNNIFQHVTTPNLEGAGTGNVWGYNYAIDMVTTTASWLYPANMHHDPGTAMELMEGNVMPSAMEDTIHGTHALNTYFRNRFSGLDPANTQTQQTVPILLQSFSRYANIVGNILGTSGYHNTYSTNTGASSVTNCDTSIYNFGWGDTECSSSTSSGAVMSDALTTSSAMLWGNYDTVNAAVRWQTSEDGSGAATYPGLSSPSQTLPASFYLSATPSWWGTTPWPSIGPDVTGGTAPGGHSYVIPAQNCYVNVMGGPTTSEASAALAFNAATCYTQAAGQQTASSSPVPPTNITATVTIP